MISRARDRRHRPDRRLGRARRRERAGVERVRGWDPDADAPRGRGRARRGRRGGRSRGGARRRRARRRRGAGRGAAGPGAGGARRGAGDCTVTDVGSTKGGVVAAAAGDRRASSAAIRSAAPRRAARSGRRAELFDGATWFLTPMAATEPERYTAAARLRRLARRGAGRDRPRGARPARRDHEPPAARARERAR